MNPLYLFVFTKVASTAGFLIAVSLLLLCLYVRGEKRTARVFLLGAVVLMFLVEILKDTFHVARPLDALITAAGYAWPSGHAAGSAFLAVLISYVSGSLAKPLRYGVYAASSLMALTIGLSRIQLGVHTPYQVVAGYGIGVAVALVCIGVLRRKWRRASEQV